MSDLNITLIQNYLKEIKSSLYEKAKTGDFVEVCQDMNIVSALPEYTKPKNVGLMFLVWNRTSSFRIPRLMWYSSQVDLVVMILSRKLLKAQFINNFGMHCSISKCDYYRKSCKTSG